jgi:hypothetical protein
MTTYSYRLTLNDGEVFAVQEALRLYIILCKSEVGPEITPKIKAPLAVQAVMGRLYSDTQMTSTSSFCWPERPGEEP